jgi:hypothetical protein
MEIEKSEFDDIRPYYDREINAAVKRICLVPEFEQVARFVFPERSYDETRDMLCDIQTSDDFQLKFMYPAVRKIVSQFSDGLTSSGFDDLDRNTPYLFISNHRDIVLDSAILQSLLVDHDMPRTEITFGSNLMINPFIIDFGKVNKMYKVHRGGTKIELLKNSIHLSKYIRFTIVEKQYSSWIAQRNGRTKDGHDKTEEALLKMINLSGPKDFTKSFTALNIIPLTISYEYEPCGTLKVNELYRSMNSDYQKKPGEDLNSIMTGFIQPKGKIHLSAGKCVNAALSEFDNSLPVNENINRLTVAIDRQIYHDYKLWKTNYIAYDILEKPAFAKEYTAEEKDAFLKFIEKEINLLEGDKTVLMEMYLKMYANPVINFLRLNK